MIWVAKHPTTGEESIVRDEQWVDWYKNYGWYVEGPYVLTTSVLQGFDRAEPDPNSEIYYKRGVNG